MGDDFDDDATLSDPMTDIRHRRFLLALDVPEELHDEPEEWCGWTAGVVRMSVARMAQSVRRSTTVCSTTPPAEQLMISNCDGRRRQTCGRGSRRSAY